MLQSSFCGPPLYSQVTMQVSSPFSCKEEDWSFYAGRKAEGQCFQMRQSYKLTSHGGLTPNHQETTNLTVLFISRDETDIKHRGTKRSSLMEHLLEKSNKDQTAQFSHLKCKSFPRVTLQKSKFIMLHDLTMACFRKN